MIPLTIHDIKKFLQEKGVPAETQEPSGQLLIRLNILEKEVPLFIRIYDGGEIVQLLAFLPFQINQTTLADTARLLCFLNKELDVPGFGMEEERSLIFFRAMIPVKEKQLEPVFLQGFFNAVQVACRTFLPVIAAVVAGQMTYADVIKKAKEQAKAKPQQQQQ